jgi:hypothetical protein
MTALAHIFAVLVSAAGSAVAHTTPRNLDPPRPLQTSVASWYADSGPGACGWGAQVGLRFASLFLTCGTHVEFCYAGCAVGEMADHGPYVTGRTFDLNENLRAAINCTDLCPVRWRVLP